MSRVFNTARQVWSTKSQVTRNIWLAGLGAYDKSVCTVSSTLSKGQVIFDELIVRGKSVEEGASSSYKMNKQKFSDVRSEVQDNFQGKVHQTVTNLTNIDTDKFDSILAKIEQVEAALVSVKAQQQEELENEHIKSELQEMSTEVAQAVSENEIAKPKAAKKPAAKKPRKSAAKKNK